jgi:hypothetical protein
VLCHGAGLGLLIRDAKRGHELVGRPVGRMADWGRRGEGRGPRLMLGRPGLLFGLVRRSERVGACPGRPGEDEANQAGLSRVGPGELRRIGRTGLSRVGPSSGRLSWAGSAELGRVGAAPDRREPGAVVSCRAERRTRLRREPGAVVSGRAEGWIRLRRESHRVSWSRAVSRGLGPGRVSLGLGPVSGWVGSRRSGLDRAARFGSCRSGRFAARPPRAGRGGRAHRPTASLPISDT